MAERLLPATVDPTTLTLLIDQRERHFIDAAPMQSEICYLPYGDYALKGVPLSVAVAERKSESDFVACCAGERNRFMGSQIQRLKGSLHKILVIESTAERLEAGNWRSKVTPQSVIGTLQAIMLEGVPVALVGDHERAGRFIVRWFWLLASRRLQESRELLGEIRHRQKSDVIA